jgi:histidine triad (HIT) family protein
MENCIFCKIAGDQIPAYKIYEDENTLAFLDISPISEFHTLVIPKAHYPNAIDIPGEAFLQVMDTVKKVVDLYKEKLGLENLQLLHNAGEAGQQDVFHLHVHIVPRAAGDGKDAILPSRQPELKEKFSEMIQKLEA